VATAKCAVCNRELPVSKLKRCNDCEIWLCKNHVKYPLMGTAKCPKCGKSVK